MSLRESNLNTLQFPNLFPNFEKTTWLTEKLIPAPSINRFKSKNHKMFLHEIFIDGQRAQELQSFFLSFSKFKHEIGSFRGMNSAVG